MYILDTNTLIYFFRGTGNVAEKLLNTPPKNIGIPAVVLYELEYGIAKSTSPEKRMKQLEEICALVEVLPFGSEQAKSTALIRAYLDKKGTPIGPYDVMIAGTAINRQGILVTRNVKEFNRVPDLKIENWF